MVSCKMVPGGFMMDNMTQHAAWKFINALEQVELRGLCGMVCRIPWLSKYPCTRTKGHEGLHSCTIPNPSGNSPHFSSIIIHFIRKGDTE
jgi:hypothetical protein